MFARLFDRRKAASRIVAALSMLWLAACDPTLMAPGVSGGGGPAIDPSDPVQVALLVPRGSGDPSDDFLATNLENAARLAISDLSGVSIDLRVYSTGASPALAAQAAQTAIGDGAQIILGPLYAEAANAAGVVAAPAGINVLSFSNNTTIAGGNVFVLGPTFRNTANRLVRHGVRNGIDSYVIVHADDLQGAVGRDAIASAVRGNGGRVAGIQSYPLSQQGILDAVPRIAEAARRAGFEEIHERLFAIELDVDVPASEQPSQEASPKRRRGRRPMAATHLRQARQLAQRMEADESFGREEAAVSLGISLEHLDNQLALLCLAPEVQERILEWGERFPFGEARLRKLIKLPPEAQLSALDEQLEALTVQLSTTSGDNAGDDDERIGPLRMVAYFNPQLFVDIRRRTAEHCEKLRRHAAQFNAELAAAKRSRSRDATYRKFSAELERLNYLGAFDIELEPLTLRSKTGKTITSFQGRFIRKEQEWKRRRRYDGFVLLLGDPLLPQSARELVQLYRIKDIVEKDFQSIKSAIKLRPVFHYTDPKVQAHVTVCMLALLLQRTLEQRLAAAGHPMTAPACIEALNTCHLNQRRTANGSPLYDITQLTSDQQAIVDALDLRPLADEQHVRVALVPREPSLQEPSR